MYISVYYSFCALQIMAFKFSYAILMLHLRMSQATSFVCVSNFAIILTYFDYIFILHTIITSAFTCADLLCCFFIVVLLPCCLVYSFLDTQMNWLYHYWFIWRWSEGYATLCLHRNEAWTKDTLLIIHGLRGHEKTINKMRWKYFESYPSFTL